MHLISTIIFGLGSDHRPRWSSLGIRVKLIPHRIHARIMHMNVGQEHRCVNNTFESASVTTGVLNGSLDVVKSGQGLFPDFEA